MMLNLLSCRRSCTKFIILTTEFIIFDHIFIIVDHIFIIFDHIFIIVQCYYKTNRNA